MGPGKLPTTRGLQDKSGSSIKIRCMSHVWKLNKNHATATRTPVCLTQARGLLPFTCGSEALAPSPPRSRSRQRRHGLGFRPPRRGQVQPLWLCRGSCCPARRGKKGRKSCDAGTREPQCPRPGKAAAQAAGPGGSGAPCPVPTPASRSGLGSEMNRPVAISVDNSTFLSGPSAPTAAYMTLASPKRIQSWVRA